MTDFAIIALNSVIRSGLYALVAIGFTLIFGVGGTLNLAHGASITIGAYTAILLGWAGFDPWLAGIAGAAVAGLFSGLVYLILRSKQEDTVVIMILTLIIALFVEQMITIFIGARARGVPSFLSGNTQIAGYSVPTNGILAFVCSWILIGLLLLAINRTRTGQAVLATSMDRKGASMVGIDSDRIYLYVWVFAGAIAGLAGVFLGSINSANPVMGRAPLVLSFSIVILGGIGSIWGSIVGAYIIGFLEVFVVSTVSPRMSGVASLVILVLVLLIKPKGLFGRELPGEH